MYHGTVASPTLHATNLGALSDVKYCSSLPLQDAQVHQGLSRVFRLIRHQQKAKNKYTVTCGFRIWMA